MQGSQRSSKAWHAGATATTKTLTAGQPVVIKVTATDRPGNKTVKTQAKA